jgi:hypothetical protein
MSAHAVSYHLQNEFSVIDPMMYSVFDVINSIYHEKVDPKAFADVFYDTIMNALVADYATSKCARREGPPDYLFACHIDLMKSAAFAANNQIHRAVQDEREFCFALTKRISQEGFKAIPIVPIPGVDR